MAFGRHASSDTPFLCLQLHQNKSDRTKCRLVRGQGRRNAAVHSQPDHIGYTVAANRLVTAPPEDKQAALQRKSRKKDRRTAHWALKKCQGRRLVRDGVVDASMRQKQIQDYDQKSPQGRKLCTCSGMG